MVQKQDMVKIRVKSASKSSLLWLVRELQETPVDDTATKMELIEILQAIFPDGVPEQIGIPRIIVEGKGKAPTFQQAPQRSDDWPGNPELLRNGFDEHGNEYWVAIVFRGPTQQSYNYQAGSHPNEVTEFSVDGSRIVLATNKRHCIRGRFLDMIQSREDCQMPSIDTATDEQGNRIDMTKTDWTPPTYLRPKRYDVHVLGFAGPTGSKDNRETSRPTGPNRARLQAMGVKYEEKSINNSLNYIAKRHDAQLKRDRVEARERARRMLEDSYLMDKIDHEDKLQEQRERAEA